MNYSYVLDDDGGNGDDIDRSVDDDDGDDYDDDMQIQELYEYDAFNRYYSL